MHLVGIATCLRLDTHSPIHAHGIKPRGPRQPCSLKRKVNSCACDSWSSHDIPSPNIRDGFGHNGVSAERGPFTTWTRCQGFRRQPGWAQFFLHAFPVIMWEVMSFSLVRGPYNSPPFASKQAQWSKLDNVVPVKNELNANVYFWGSGCNDFSSDSHQNLSLLTFSNGALNNRGCKFTQEKNICWVPSK